MMDEMSSSCMNIQKTKVCVLLPIETMNASTFKWPCVTVHSDFKYGKSSSSVKLQNNGTRISFWGCFNKSSKES